MGDDDDSNPVAAVMNTPEAAARIDAMRREAEPQGETFRVEGIELTRVNDFKAEHDRLHGTYSGAIGGRYTMQFTGTSLGTVVGVICGHCNAKQDCTEYDW